MTAQSLEGIKDLKVNAFVIIAHPDDESIFMGGTMAEFKKWRWRVACLTDCDVRFNKHRREELFAAAKIYRKSGSSVTPFAFDNIKKNGIFSKKEMLLKLKDFIHTHDVPDIVFTHNEKGEYGHKTHKLIHKVVRESGLANIYTFSFGVDNVFENASTEEVRLSNRSMYVKKQAIRLYLKGSQKTNLSRMKRLVDWAIGTKVEKFISPGNAK